MRAMLLLMMLGGFALSAWGNIAAKQIQQALLLGKTQAIHTNDRLSTIKDLQQHYGFVIFFRSTCPHCRRFIPVLKDFAHYYHVPIHAYRVDGEDLDHLQASKMTAMDYKNYFLAGGFKAVIPALYLQNRITHQIYPVLFGQARPYQLAKRVSQLMRHIEASEHD